MKQILYITAVCLLLPGLKAQHNSNYVQYMFNGLILNPAYAGSQEALNLTGLYRKQWMGINGAPTEALFSIHSPLKNKNVNLGANFQDTQFGLFNHTRFNLVYAYRFRFLSGKLAFGLQAGIDSYTTNWDRLNTTEAGDPSFQLSGTRNTVPEAGAGFYYNTKIFYLGVSAPNLFTGKLNPYTTSCLSSGIVINLSPDFRMKPALLLKYVNGSTASANLSTTFYYKEIIGLGIGYTYNNSALVYTDIKLNEQLHFGYGYEYALNHLQTYITGSHEVMIRYLFRYKINSANPRFF